MSTTSESSPSLAPAGEYRVAEHHGWGPVRFSVRGLLLTITGLSLLLASYTWFGALGLLMTVFAALAIMGHVGGNWLGNELRDLGNRARSQPAQSYPGQPLAGPSDAGSLRSDSSHTGSSQLGPPNPVAASIRLELHHYAPATSLRHRVGLSWRCKVAVIVGGVLAMIGGTILLHLVSGDRATWTSSLAGGLACGLLGAIWTFAGVSFLSVGWRAWQQAAESR